ncbi:hypothetical protein [Pseudoalteromonas prydzensis]|uniref:hypothetical protein n=1 Tax=Pseudoalteromonas prydzensis TaxID=182141 RepID=UPI003FD0809D
MFCIKRIDESILNQYLKLDDQDCGCTRMNEEGVFEEWPEPIALTLLIDDLDCVVFKPSRHNVDEEAIFIESSNVKELIRFAASLIELEQTSCDKIRIIGTSKNNIRLDYSPIKDSGHINFGHLCRYRGGNLEFKHSIEGSVTVICEEFESLIHEECDDHYDHAVHNDKIKSMLGVDREEIKPIVMHVCDSTIRGELNKIESAFEASQHQILSIVHCGVNHYDQYIFVFSNKSHDKAYISNLWELKYHASLPDGYRVSSLNSCKACQIYSEFDHYIVKRIIQLNPTISASEALEYTWTLMVAGCQTYTNYNGVYFTDDGVLHGTSRQSFVHQLKLNEKRYL